MANILITGATGLLGSNLAVELSLLGHRVFAASRNPINNKDYEFVYLDLNSSWNITDLPEEIDIIYHLAQSDRFREFPDGAMDVFNVNIHSTAKLLEYARTTGVKKFIYASSGGVYGTSVSPFHENSPINPPGALGYYLGSKACSEILVQSYASELQVVIVRPFFVYGLEQNRSMLIPRLFDNVASENLIQLSGENGIRINPIHVIDAVNALIAVSETSESRTYNLGGPEVLSIRGISELFGKYLGKGPIFDLSNDSPQYLLGDISLMSKELCQPQIKLSDKVFELEIKSPFKNKKRP